MFNRIFWEICYTRFHMVLLYKVAIKNINDNRISTSIQSFPVSKFWKPFFNVLLTSIITTWKAPNFHAPKMKYLQVVGIYELEGFPSLVSQGEAGGRSGSSWSRFLAQEASGGSWLTWSDRRERFQKEVKRCTGWVLELTVLYIYIHMYIFVYCRLYSIVVFCFL